MIFFGLGQIFVLKTFFSLERNLFGMQHFVSKACFRFLNRYKTLDIS